MSFLFLNRPYVCVLEGFISSQPVADKSRTFGKPPAWEMRDFRWQQGVINVTVFVHCQRLNLLIASEFKPFCRSQNRFRTIHQPVCKIVVVLVFLFRHELVERWNEALWMIRYRFFIQTPVGFHPMDNVIVCIWVSCIRHMHILHKRLFFKIMRTIHTVVHPDLVCRKKHKLLDIPITLTNLVLMQCSKNQILVRSVIKAFTKCEQAFFF